MEDQEKKQQPNPDKILEQLAKDEAVAMYRAIKMYGPCHECRSDFCHEMKRILERIDGQYYDITKGGQAR